MDPLFHINNEIALTEEKLNTLKTLREIQDTGYRSDLVFIASEIQKDKDQRTQLVTTLQTDNVELRRGIDIREDRIALLEQTLRDNQIQVPLAEVIDTV